jgi:peptidoglycan/LPS O-acetylase OafA/YrhL
MKNIVPLMKNGYDPFIDFLKGWSILMVILTHALPNSVRDLTFFSVWGGVRSASLSSYSSFSYL